MQNFQQQPQSPDQEFFADFSKFTAGQQPSSRVENHHSSAAAATVTAAADNSSVEEQPSVEQEVSSSGKSQEIERALVCVCVHYSARVIVASESTAVAIISFVCSFCCRHPVIHYHRRHHRYRH